MTEMPLFEKNEIVSDIPLILLFAITIFWNTDIRWVKVFKNTRRPSKFVEDSL